MRQTIAQQLKVTEFPFIIKDKNDNTIYYEDSNNRWYKYEYDSNNNTIYYETSYGWWFKREYDSNGNQIYFESSNGDIKDNRPKPSIELTLDEIANKLGINVSQLKIKK